MTIKSILTICDGTQEEISELNVALALAKAFSAQLRILHVTPPMVPYMGEMTGYETVVTMIEKDNEERLAFARKYAEHYCALHHVPLDAPSKQIRHTSACFIHSRAPMDAVVTREGRLNDLIVLGRKMYGADITNNDALISALFDSGKSVLVAPELHGPLPREWECKTVVVCWNDSREASRALYDAMPFLEGAEKVHVLISHEHREPCHLDEGAGVMGYLQSHGIASDVTMISGDSLSVGKMLLAKAKELDADLLVMGAYSHTRMRELIWGGVTHEMLRNADLPVLLAH